MNIDYLKILDKGVEFWNSWRSENPSAPDLRRAPLSGRDLRGANLNHVDFENAELEGTKFGALFPSASRASLRDADLSSANLMNADLQAVDMAYSRLPKADLRGAKLTNANLEFADISKAWLMEAQLNGANLADANLVNTDFTDANLCDANLSRATLIKTVLEGATLTGARVYGASVWDVSLRGAKQLQLVITPEDYPTLTVDNLEVAQFIYLLLAKPDIRAVIDTITSKAVFILGRFSKERKPILDALRESIRQRNLTPIVFDFTIPSNRDVTETVKVLAGLAKFVVADVTDATEVRAELHNIVPDFPSLPVQPLVLAGKREFVSLPGHLTKYPWVLPTFEYQDLNHLLANLDIAVIEPAVVKQRELGR